MSDAHEDPGGLTVDDAAGIGDVEDDGSPLRAGRVIAERYRLDEPIGTGGSATIWLATHLALNRPVAVKFVDVVGPRQEAMRERFLREARVAAAIRHRNVVDIVDFGTDARQPFMVMELLDGRTLARRIEEGDALTVSEAVRTIAPVLSGLAAVHEEGIVHRDLKPENIFLVEDADGWFPKLIDFGVSRVLDPELGLESVLPTRDNVIVGTPHYMSPEQARGLREIDHRADIWSAGVMLYELLTGVLPFDSDAIGDVIIEVATADVVPVSTLRPDLAGPLEDVVHRALARDLDARFQSAAEMRIALLTAVKETAAEILERRPPDRASYRPRRKTGPAPPLDVAEVSEELDAIDAHIGPKPKREPSVRDDSVTLAAPPSIPPPTRPGRSPLVWIAVVGLAVVLSFVGIAWMRGSSDPPATPTTQAPRTVPNPEPPIPPEEPEEEEAPPPPEVVEAELPSADASDEPAPRRGRRRAHLVRDPGF